MDIVNYTLHAILHTTRSDRGREMTRAAPSVSREQLVHCEKALAVAALEDRGDSYVLETFRRRECSQRERGLDSHAVDYERYGLVPIHRDTESWVYVSEDPQLAIAIEEIVNTFSPALSVELLLYNVLGSNSESATQLLFGEPRVHTHQDHTEEHDPLDRFGRLCALRFLALEES